MATFFYINLRRHGGWRWFEGEEGTHNIVWSNGLCIKVFTYMACGRRDVKGPRKRKGKKQLLLNNENKIPSQIYHILVNSVMPFLQIGREITIHKAHPK